MNKNCKNCKTELNGNFCSHCGQSANTHRINFHFLWHDIQHGLFHFDKGILFTTKELFTRPGVSIKEFLDGKRVNHFKPFSFVIILAGLYGLLAHYFDINLLSNNFNVTGEGEEFVRTKASLEKMTNWVSQHYSLISLFQIPVFAFGTYIAFKKVGYNYIEHLVINSFIAGQKLIIRLLSFPLFVLFNNSTNLIQIARYTDILGYVVSIWTLIKLFNQISISKRILRVIFAMAISLLFIFAILTIAGIIFLSPN